MYPYSKISIVNSNDHRILSLVVGFFLVFFLFYFCEVIQMERIT